MRKYFAMALMAFAALAVTSCDSDEILQKAIDKVVAVVNSKVVQGSMPSATDNIDGLTNTITQSNEVTSIVVNSPVELSKFFISVDGVDGYLECPAEIYSNASAGRAEVANYSYVVVIALGDGAAKTVKISVNAETVDGKVVEVVGKVEVVNTDKGDSSSSALVGVWTMLQENESIILTVTEKTYSYSSPDSQVPYETGNYTYRDGYIYCSYMDATQKVEEKYSVGLYCNNNALVLTPVYSYRDSLGNEVEELEEHGLMLFYKQNAKFDLSVKDIQGTWLWMMERYDGGQEVRVAMIFDGNTFDYIIPAWGDRMKGSFTYQNGIVTFNVSEYLVNESRPCGIDDYKDGYEKPSANSSSSEPEPPFGKQFSRPFLPVGTFAFSNNANMPCRLIKQ